jgi:hypothetical protein
MSTARITTITTVLTAGAVVVWGVKALVIGLAGGLDKSPLEGPLFMIGFLLFVSGVIAIGLAVTAGRGVAARVLGAVAAFAVTAAVFLGVDSVVAGLAPENDPHWVWAEVQLWIVSVAAAAGWLAIRNRVGVDQPVRA